MIKDDRQQLKPTTSDTHLLTSMEWEVYKLLKERSKRGIWTMQNDIHNYFLCFGKNVSFRNVRQMIYNIRHCDIIQKVVISCNKGYMIMTDKEEHRAILDKQLHEALKKLKQYHKELDRLSKNGQMKLTFNTSERNFIESLLKVDDNDGTKETD